MASVSLAEDTVLGRLVALKRVYASDDPRKRLRLEREARVGASLNHPNLVFVYDVRTEGEGDLVIVMEYVDGQALSERIAAGGSVPPREALRILREVASGLDAVHAKGIVHRDVKPANILLSRDGAVRLVDLGVAGATDRDRNTSAEAVVGTFSYMALEQLEGAAPSPAMDVYALAAVAYELLSGKKARPETNPLALARAISMQPAPDLRSAWRDAPAPAAAILKRGMSRDPWERPSSAGELVKRLQRALESHPATAAVPAVAFASADVAFAKHPNEQSRPRRWGAARLRPALAAVAVLAMAAAAVAVLSSNHRKRSPAATSALAARSSRSTTSGASRTPTATAQAPSSAGASASSPGAGSSSAGANSNSAASTTGTQPGTPSGAVEAFYEAAAAHRYPAAWALTDASMRSELGGFLAFQNEMSSVRSIAFHRAQVLGGPAAGSATVALQTTAVQTDRTQQCAGTANTVRSGGGWLLDGISISCS